MIEVIYGPEWFYNSGLFIDSISLVVLFLIGFFSIKYYNINKSNKNYLYLGMSFFVLSVSFLSLILMNAAIYYDLLELTHGEYVTISYEAFEWADAIAYFGLLLYRLLAIFGLYFLYSIYLKQSRPVVFLVSYLILISTFFSVSAYYIFHLTSLILLTLITLEYQRQYSRTKNSSTKMLAYSFGIIAISQVVAIFIKLHSGFYVLSQSIQLIGYILLLATFILVLKHGKKNKN